MEMVQVRGMSILNLWEQLKNSFIMKSFLDIKGGLLQGFDYSWAWRCRVVKIAQNQSPSGSGDFQQKILEGDIVTIGDIPPDVKNLYIELISDEDVDIQLYDKDDGVKIIAWPDGILRGRDRESTEYKGDGD